MTLRRRLAATATILSALLCLATISLLIRSFWYEDFIRYSTHFDVRNPAAGQRRVTFGSRMGVLGFSHVRLDFSPSKQREILDGGSVDLYKQGLSLVRERERPRQISYNAVRDSDIIWPGFGAMHTVDYDPTPAMPGTWGIPGAWDRRWTRAGVAVPHGIFALLFAIAPIQWLRKTARRQRRHRRGACLDCGYDLRATPPGQRCPECGVVSTVA